MFGSDAGRQHSAVGKTRYIDPSAIHRVAPRHSVNRGEDKTHIVEMHLPGLAAAVARVPVAEKVSQAEALGVNDNEALTIGQRAQPAFPLELARGAECSMQRNDH